MPKVCLHWEMTSGGRAEIQNGLIFKVLVVWIFSSATRGHFSNVNIYLYFGMFGHLAKKASYRFLKDGLAAELLG